MNSFFVFVLTQLTWSLTFAQEGLISAFELEKNDLEIRRAARPFTPFDKVGRKFAILGYESGIFEAWAYPLKLFRNFELSFLLGNSTRPIKASEVLRWITATPEATTITYTHQSFTVTATYVTAINEPGAMILLNVQAIDPLTIVCGFLPVLQPMWPAGVGGQYAYWDDKLNAYIISESSGGSHGLLGTPAASGISYTPAHMLSDTPMEFKIEIKDPRAVSDKFIPVYMAGGKGKFQSVRELYESLQKAPESIYKEAFAHYRRLRDDLLQVVTPNKELNLAFEWAKVAYDNLVVDNPDLGKGLVAGLGVSGTSGRPGFGWFFGGDAYINSFSLNSFCNYSTVKDALAFTQKTQRADGKMAHELSQAAGYIDWFGKYHYGYIHGDTTPFYLAAMYDYYNMSGDLAFVKESWPSLKRAYDWCLTTDTNQDGLMENKKAGLGAVEFGALTGIEADIYLSAVWVRAAYATLQLAQAVQDDSTMRGARAAYEKANKAFDKKFWNEKGLYYSYAFNAQGEQVAEVTPWSAVALSWKIGDSVHSVRSLERLSSSEMTTDWGVRSISKKSKYYEPMNYNYGAVWPFIGSWIATAQYKHHFSLQGYQTLMAAVRHSTDNQVGTVSEVFSGATNIWLQESVSHQGFSSAGVVLPFVRGMLGLEGSVVEKTISFAPHFPADWSTVSVKNYRVGKSILSFEYLRKNDVLILKVESRNNEGHKLKFAPALGIGTKIVSMSANGSDTKFQIQTSQQTVQPVAVVELKEGTTILEVKFTPTLELLPPPLTSETGDGDRGLKILSLQHQGTQLNVDVEGLSGEEYNLQVTKGELIRNVVGGYFNSGEIRVKIPPGKTGDFVRHSLQIFLK